MGRVMTAHPASSWKPIAAVAVIALAAMLVFSGFRGGGSSHAGPVKQARLAGATIERVK